MINGNRPWSRDVVIVYISESEFFVVLSLCVCINANDFIVFLHSFINVRYSTACSASMYAEPMELHRYTCKSMAIEIAPAGGYSWILEHRKF